MSSYRHHISRRLGTNAPTDVVCQVAEKLYPALQTGVRISLLDVVKQSMTLQLKEYGIPFDLEERPINVDAPITI